MTQAILFDVDGTLIDSVDLHARAWQEALAKFGVKASFEAVRSQIGKGGDQLMPVFVPENRLAIIGDELENYRGELYKAEYLKRVQPFPGVRALFKELLRRGLKLALCSSAKGDELDLYKCLVHVEDLIDAETSSDDARRTKPHPDIFQAGLRRLGKDIKLDEVIVVGDSPFDAIAAHRMGVRAVGVLSGGFPEEDLREAGCIAIYQGPEDLLRKLDQSPLV
jgi:HAD superfamily hydrolase (TIGR01509 family)